MTNEIAHSKKKPKQTTILSTRGEPKLRYVQNNHGIEPIQDLRGGGSGSPADDHAGGDTYRGPSPSDDNHQHNHRRQTATTTRYHSSRGRRRRQPRQRHKLPQKPARQTPMSRVWSIPAHYALFDVWWNPVTRSELTNSVCPPSKWTYVPEVRRKGEVPSTPASDRPRCVQHQHHCRDSDHHPHTEQRTKVDLNESGTPYTRNQV